jgi:anti-sigma B factor antagonist
MPTRNPNHSCVHIQTGTCSRRERVAAVELPEEIDCSNASDVVEDLCRLLVGPRRTIRVDLAEVTFMDSSGIGACLEAQRCARRAGYDMVFADPNASVTRVIELMGLERILLQALRS